MPPARFSARPERNDIVASVAMKGKTRSRVMIRPLIKPATSPVAMPINAPGTMPYCIIASAVTTLTSATIAPTERSRPAVRITSVCPNATMASADAWSPMFRKFGRLRKTSDMEAKKISRAATASGSPISRPCRAKSRATLKPRTASLSRVSPEPAAASISMLPKPRPNCLFIPYSCHTNCIQAP